MARAFLLGALAAALFALAVLEVVYWWVLAGLVLTLFAAVALVAAVTVWSNARPDLHDRSWR